MTTNEKQIYELLAANPYLSQKELSDITGLSRPTVANIISALNEQGYILGKPYVLNTKKIITCIGGANVDTKLTLFSELIADTSNPVKKLSSLGGVIRNVAENLARLSKEVSLMTKVGNDIEGNLILSKSAELMQVFASDQDAEYSTGTYVAVLDKHGDLTYGFADMQICESMDSAWIIEHKKHVLLSDIVVCDTNIQKSAVESLTEICKDKKLILIGVSVAKLVNIPEDLSNVYLAILNKDEALALTNCSQVDETLFDVLKARGLKRAIVTLGSKGCVFYDENESFKNIKAKKVKNIVDVTGAGDSFCAGVIYALSEGKSLSTACKYGRKLAGFTLQKSESVRRDVSKKIFKNMEQKNH